MEEGVGFSGPMPVCLVPEAIQSYLTLRQSFILATAIWDIKI